MNNAVIVPCRCEELCVKFGEVGKNSLPAQLHFNPDIGNLEVLVTTNAYCDKESKEYLGFFKQQFFTIYTAIFAIKLQVFCHKYTNF